MADVKYRDLLKQLKADGWEVVVIRGSHRQLKHPVKRGRVTVAGSPNDDVHPKTLKSIRRQAGWED
jgi:predicted RNA binding protein YcfA (HicA-like mRNA interferase family)